MKHKDSLSEHLTPARSGMSAEEAMQATPGPAELAVLRQIMRRVDKLSVEGKQYLRNWLGGQ